MSSRNVTLGNVAKTREKVTVIGKVVSFVYHKDFYIQINMKTILHSFWFYSMKRNLNQVYISSSYMYMLLSEFLKLNLHICFSLYNFMRA